jgi:hypothetical protein
LAYNILRTGRRQELKVRCIKEGDLYFMKELDSHNVLGNETEYLPSVYNWKGFRKQSHVD